MDHQFNTILHHNEHLDTFRQCSPSQLPVVRSKHLSLSRSRSSSTSVDTLRLFFFNPFLQVCLLEIRRSRTCQRSLLLQYEHVSVQHSFLALKYCHLRSQPSHHLDTLFQIWRESFSKHLQVGINTADYIMILRIDF